MLKKNTILNILTWVAWISLGSGVLILLISAVNAEKQETCHRIAFSYRGDSSYQMVTEEEILQTIWPLHSSENPLGKSIASFDLLAIEEKIEKNPWIKNADVFFDHHQVMHIDIWQREPLARLFSPEGSSMFLDEHFNTMPLKTSDVLKLPVFTNFTVSGDKKTSKDSALLDRIVSLSEYIKADEFWMAQVEAVNIQYDGSFELTMQLGDETILTGMRSDWEKLFTKLKLTYEKFARDQLWGKYDKINLQFINQVVCSKKVHGHSISDTTNNLLTIQ